MRRFDGGEESAKFKRWEALLAAGYPQASGRLSSYEHAKYKARYAKGDAND